MEKLFLQNILAILTRDLRRLIEEIQAYKNETLLWEVTEGISNSPGTLCLHVTGNLNHFIGAVLGNTGYVRNREHEFIEKNVSREQIIHRLEDTLIMVENVLPKLPAASVTKPYPTGKFPDNPDTAFLLTHLTGHLSYHLGQVNYHRRLKDT